MYLASSLGSCTGFRSSAFTSVSVLHRHHAGRHTGRVGHLPNRFTRAEALDTTSLLTSRTARWLGLLEMAVLQNSNSSSVRRLLLPEVFVELVVGWLLHGRTRRHNPLSLLPLHALPCFTILFCLRVLLRQDHEKSGEESGKKKSQLKKIMQGFDVRKLSCVVRGWPVDVGEPWIPRTRISSAGRCGQRVGSPASATWAGPAPRSRRAAS